MAEQRGEMSLPRVEEVDLAFILFEDITDPSHQQRWEWLAHSNPELAAEILKRADSIISSQSEVNIRKEAIDLTTFVISALDRALKRHSAALGTICGDGASLRP